jgi:two-component system, chemotaxis family, chemotaxis protein CheY
VAAFDSNILAKRVIDALRMVYRGAIEQARDVRPSLPMDTGSRLATVKLIGSPSYRIMVTTNVRGGYALAQAMFACTEQDVNRIMIDDAMCELANMTAGQVKGLIAQTHRINHLGIVRGDQLDRNSKLLVGTCLRLPGANAEISILLAETPVATATVVGTSIGANDHKAIPDAPPTKPETVHVVPLETNAREGGGIAPGPGTSVGQVTSIDQVELSSAVEQGLLVELSAAPNDTPPDSFSSLVDEPESSVPDVAIAVAGSRYPGEGALAVGDGPAASESSVEVTSIASHLASSTTGGRQQPAITAAGEYLSSDAGSGAPDYLTTSPDAVDEAPLAINSTDTAMQETAGVAQAMQNITSHARDMPTEAGMRVNDPTAADAIAEEYLSVKTAADSIEPDHFASVLIEHIDHAVDRPVTVRPSRRRRLEVNEDDRFRVMIAQGNEALLKVIRRAVLARNMRLVAIARDGDETVREALRARPDLLCLDLSLGKQDGLQVLARIRRELPTLSVAIVSASATMPQVREAMELQVVSIIVSPLNHSRLTAELARIAPFTLPGNGGLRTHTDVSSTPASEQMSRLQ